MLTQTLEIVKLNFKLEWRRKQSFLAILLYVVTSVYLAYLVFNGEISTEGWNSLFWITLIFACLQAAFRSFVNEADRRFLLYFGMLKPQVLILGKILYNFIYMFTIGLVGFGLFMFFLGDAVSDKLAFIVLIILASLGFSAILTFVSGISAKAGENPALPAILSIPLLYPQVLTLSKVSLRSLTGFDWELNAPLLLVLLLMGVVTALLSYVLFAYLWRD